MELKKELDRARPGGGILDRPKNGKSQVEQLIITLLTVSDMLQHFHHRHCRCELIEILCQVMETADRVALRQQVKIPAFMLVENGRDMAQRLK